MSLLSRIRIGILGVALAGILGEAAFAKNEGPNPRPSQTVHLPFLRRYVKPAAAPQAGLAPASVKNRPTVKGRGQTANARGRARPKSTAKAPARRGRPQNATVQARPPARRVPVAAPRTVVRRTAPQLTPPVQAQAPAPVRQPARVEAPTPYSASPMTNPNTTTSTSVLPLHPSTAGRKPPAKTIFLDMTHPYR